MDRQNFRRALTERAFDEIFNESGWNKPSSAAPMPITIGDGENEKTYEFREVAQCHARVYVCEVNELPRTSEQSAIDSKLRRLNAAGYIAIYVKANEECNHLWVVPVQLVDKRTLVKIAYANAEQTNLIHEKVDLLSFPIGSEINATEALAKINEVFAVNATQVTKKFYTEFRKEHSKFVEGILNIANDKDRDWYASVMLNRLMFCYFIQKKGFLDCNVNYLRVKLAEVQEKSGRDKFYGTFYRAFLRKLFADGLNAPTHTAKFEASFGMIPYLNGGMFDEHELEKKYKDIDIKDEIFERLFAFFDEWNWHLDTSVTASGRDINPDVLGYIFEQYINDRAAMGAYYTKEDITDYIGKNCIIPFLFDRLAEGTSGDALKPDGAVWRHLKASGERYIYDAVKKGFTDDWRTRIPKNIARGIDAKKPNLLERRADWNTAADGEFALPTEIWRETVERLTRCERVKAKIASGEITSINDFITENLNIRAFAQDLLAQSGADFVRDFYHELRKVTILDPTCGSGAFLFAALNILEPLYEECITRMTEFRREDGSLFKEELEEIESKYRSNIQYFIYKSIILRNLYGVDVMVEATEIAKLRLFLKLVAVVDVDSRADNLGLDPLPDIDFNIRCGNTLVGYATAKELENDWVNGDMFEILEFKQRVVTQMESVAEFYGIFKDMQVMSDCDPKAFKNAKAELRKRLAKLNDTLNARLYGKDPDLAYNNWLASHQPFHWLAEFYEIIHDRGGFDIIIGNPPYVEYSKVQKYYTLKNYKTMECGNLYAFVIERCETIANGKKKMGMIIPHSSMCTDRMAKLYQLLKGVGGWFSFYDVRPSKLFDGVEQRLLICLITKDAPLKTTTYQRWHAGARQNLFSILQYANVIEVDDFISLTKISSEYSESVLQKILPQSKLDYASTKMSSQKFYYHNAPRYFTRATNFEPYFWNEKDGEKLSVSLKPFIVGTKDNRDIATAIINSSLFYLWFIALSDCRHLNAREVTNFPCDLAEMSDENRKMLVVLCKKLMKDFEAHKNRKETYYKATGKVVYDEYYPKLSKPIIDEIDKVLAGHYGFTEEELDFIINYDIKYRMGDALEGGE